MVAAAVALLLALDWGGTHYSWASWQIVGLIAASAVLWVLFAVRLLTAREPFIPLAILRGKVTSTITCAAFFTIGTIIGVTIFTPLYCQMVLGASAERVRLGADRIYGRRHARLVDDRAVAGAPDPLHARADRRPRR